MKEVIFQNIFNQEIVKCLNPRDVEIIDGIEYIRVSKTGKDKTFLMRKDSLKKVKPISQKDT